MRRLKNILGVLIFYLEIAIFTYLLIKAGVL
jgi:hypothetical protein